MIKWVMVVYVSVVDENDSKFNEHNALGQSESASEINEGFIGFYRTPAQTQHELKQNQGNLDHFMITNSFLDLLQSFNEQTKLTKLIFHTSVCGHRK